MAAFIGGNAFRSGMNKGVCLHCGCCWLAAFIGGNAFRSDMIEGVCLVVWGCIVDVAGWLRS